MRSPRVGPWGPNVRAGAAVAGGDVGVGWPRGLVWVHGRESSCLAATGGGRRSTFALAGRTGKENLRRRRDGDVPGKVSARWSDDRILALPAVPSRRSRPHRGMPTGPEGRHAQSAASGHRLCARGRWCCAMPAGCGTGLVVSWGLSVKSRGARGSPVAAARNSPRMIACVIGSVPMRSLSRTGIWRAGGEAVACDRLAVTRGTGPRARPGRPWPA